MGARTLTLGSMIETLAEVPPAELTVDLMREHVGRLSIPSRFVRRHLRFCGESYTRSLIAKTGKFEAICMGWEPGQATRIHNHGDSFGVVLVYDGEMRSTSYARTDGGEVPGKAKLRRTAEADEGEGQVSFVDVGGIHRLGNLSAPGKRLTTIHLYARPLTWIETFDEPSEKVERSKVRYCFGEEACRLYTEGPPHPCLQKPLAPPR